MFQLSLLFSCDYFFLCLVLFCFLIKQLIAYQLMWSELRVACSESRLCPGLLKRPVYIQAASSPLFLTGKSPDKHVYLCVWSLSCFHHEPQTVMFQQVKIHLCSLISLKPAYQRTKHSCLHSCALHQSFCWEWKSLCCVPNSAWKSKLCTGLWPQSRTSCACFIQLLHVQFEHNTWRDDDGELWFCGCQQRLINSLSLTGCCSGSPLKPHPVCWKLLKPVHQTVCRLSCYQEQVSLGSLPVSLDLGFLVLDPAHAANTIRMIDLEKQNTVCDICAK